jgi:hypothetical protein
MAQSRVTRAEVLAIAKAECEALGWPWREPVRVTGGLFRYEVWTNADFRDDNPWFLFSRNGRLIRAAWAARRALGTRTAATPRSYPVIETCCLSKAT